MSSSESDPRIGEFNPYHISTYTNAIIAFTDQVAIQNSLIEKILDNTSENGKHFKDVENLSDVLKEVVADNRKITKFIENKDGLDKLVGTAHEGTQSVISELESAMKISAKEIGNSIVLRIALILAGTGLLFNTIMFWVQKYLIVPDVLSHEQLTILAKLLEEVKNATGH